MTFGDQHAARCRCEWGIGGVESLAPADVVIVVDVLSFATCVEVGVNCGAAILPYAWKDASAHDFAVARSAELAGARGTSRYSLSPETFAGANATVRCVLPSPNGAALALRAAAVAPVVLAGCLRNASAVAQTAASLGATYNVCAAGERWSDDSLRPGVEDWLGAGAILQALPGSKSPESHAAIAAFEAARFRLLDWLRQSSSGRELIERGFVGDVECAAQHDVSQAVPVLRNGEFVSAHAGHTNSAWGAAPGSPCPLPYFSAWP